MRRGGEESSGEEEDGGQALLEKFSVLKTKKHLLFNIFFLSKSVIFTEFVI